MESDELREYIKANLLDKNGNPSRKKKEKHLSQHIKQLLNSRVTCSDINEQLYCVLNSVVAPKCKCCDNSAAFLNFKQGYGVCCSVSCAAKLGAQMQAKNQYITGYRHHLQRPEVKAKRIATNLRKYGVEHVMQSQKISAKASSNGIATNISRYGVKSTLQIKEIRDKGTQTLLDKYGVTNAGFINNFKSKIEVELYEWIKQHAPDAINGYHLLGSELDIFIPSKNIAVEVNGIYYHTEMFKPRLAHHEKYIKCLSVGVKLLQFSDWQIINQREIVEAMVLSNLKICKRTAARLYDVRETTYEVAKPFLLKHHIQGAVAASLYVGLFSGETLVSVMCLNQPKANHKEKTWDIVRFASNGVSFSFAKILAHVKKTYPHITRVSSILDCMHGSEASNVYLANGFEFDRRLEPDYSYLYKDQLRHKFGFRKARLMELGGVGKTEHQLASSLNIYRSYDAGKIKYIKTLQT